MDLEISLHTRFPLLVSSSETDAGKRRRAEKGRRAHLRKAADHPNVPSCRRVDESLRSGMIDHARVDEKGTMPYCEP